MTPQELVESAKFAQRNSYAPYSGFKVGAALITKSGKVYSGCNIENSCYTPTVCAERTAFFKAVSEGENDFEAIAIVGSYKNGEYKRYCYPCGVCRQVMREFCTPDFKIILGSDTENIEITTLGALLPHSFEL